MNTATKLKRATNITISEKHYKQRQTLKTATNIKNSDEHYKQRRTLQTATNITNSDEHYKQRRTLQTATNITNSDEHYKQRRTLQTATNITNSDKHTIDLLTLFLLPEEPHGKEAEHHPQRPSYPHNQGGHEPRLALETCLQTRLRPWGVKMRDDGRR